MDRINVSLLWTLLPPMMLALSAAFGWLAIKHLRLLWRQREAPDSPFWLVRGGRALIVAIACACIAAGSFYEVRGLLWFGVAFLAEELYETGMVLLILRHHRKRLAVAAAR